jgi:hypothetical protein
MQPAAKATARPAGRPDERARHAQFTGLIDPQGIPRRVRPLLNVTGAVSARDRYAALEALGTDLATEEIEVLYRLLFMPLPADARERKRELALRNDVLNLLRKLSEQEPPPEFSEVLIALAQDRQQDVGMRHYALQHLRYWHQERAVAEEQARIEETFWSAAGETGYGIAGTGLLSLHLLGQSLTDSDRAALATTALDLAGDETADELTRITALQVCGRIGIKEAVPVAKQIAEGETAIPLKAAAIATLGDIGEGKAIGILQRMEGQSDRRLQTAAQSAIQRLARRLDSKERRL